MTIDYSDRAHWNNYGPASFGWGGRWDPMAHPDLLVPFTFTTSLGETLNFGRMHRLAVPIFREFYRRLDAKHPHVLHSDPDEGCYNPNSRTENGDRSFHTWGIATDTEWANNPMGVGVKRHGDGALPDDTDDIGRPLGIQWGGTWSNFKDWMHNEIHLSPDDCIDLGRELEHTTNPEEFHVTPEDQKLIEAIVDARIPVAAKAAAREVWATQFQRPDDPKVRWSMASFVTSSYVEAQKSRLIGEKISSLVAAVKTRLGA